MDKPTVAYMTMSWIPIFKMQSIVKIAEQDYPNDLKHLYLLNQEPFTDKLQHDMPFQITELDVVGEWPALWMRMTG